MSDLVTSCPVALPALKVDITIRRANLDDFKAIDRLQKMHNKQLGFLNRPTIEGKISLGHVLVAETGGRHSVTPAAGTAALQVTLAAGTAALQVTPAAGTAALQVGYLIGNDRYKHRDELGVIFQLCVDPNYRRLFVAANLLKAQFERSAWGCKLYCCWCAQDLPANKFYESMGFVPIAYRGGAEKKGPTGGSRVHIFWQKRIRSGDVSTPYWFPSETTGGLMDASRIALPILPGMKWWDDLPVLVQESAGEASGDEHVLKLPVEKKERKKKVSGDKLVPGMKAVPQAPTGRRVVQFGRPGASCVVSSVAVRVEEKVQEKVEQMVEKPVKQKRIKKANPELAARARELRDKYLEQFNANQDRLALPAGKYELVREIDTSVRVQMIDATQLIEPKQLIAA